LVEILTIEDSGEQSTGSKRNDLIELAEGDYTVFFDDDDEPLPGYIELILLAIQNNPDVIPINGYMTTNGLNEIYWDMGLGFGYGTKVVDNRILYERFPNHIAPMKRELIKDFKFKDITIGEDYEWAKRINDSGVFKTESRIIRPIYHYQFLEHK